VLRHELCEWEVGGGGGERWGAAEMPAARPRHAPERVVAAG